MKKRNLKKEQAYLDAVFRPRGWGVQRAFRTLRLARKRSPGYARSFWLPNESVKKPGRYKRWKASRKPKRKEGESTTNPPSSGT